MSDVENPTLSQQITESIIRNDTWLCMFRSCMGVMTVLTIGSLFAGFWILYEMRGNG
jgi:hypothetical protein